ncbi:porin [Rickettsia endosymbiont of Cardiosporidium cionae]|uniref:porin n=1 Tax=Rickettsia endosymbiont of Cardiosporidium cionae TaxID=2777155 RepID=UPI001895C8A1|nr:porin [Rickettsia endosymbiont of Cardiosporidium cionae]KAF8818315.1 hypothetical protein IHI24_000775 [Rickettsia endosymbiont of Cardiosporidium cionae]
MILKHVEKMYKFLLIISISLAQAFVYAERLHDNVKIVTDVYNVVSSVSKTDETPNIKSKSSDILLASNSSVCNASTKSEEDQKNEEKNIDNTKEKNTKGLNFNFSALANFELGFRGLTNKASDKKNVSARHERFALFNQVGVLLDISNKVNDIKYGAHISLLTAGKRSGSATFNGSHIFFETPYGKLELGAPFDASDKMTLEACSIAAAAPNSWSRYAYVPKDRGLDIGFLTSCENFLGSRLRASLNNSNTSEPSRKISYYTPEFEPFSENTKIQLGISYIPDSTNTGSDSSSKVSSKVNKHKNDLDQMIVEIDQNVKDSVSAALSVEHHINNNVGVKLVLSGEVGKSSGYAIDEKNNPKVKHPLKNLAAYNIGGVLTYGNFKYALSYGALGNSLTSDKVHKIKANAKTYSAGTAYSQGPFKVSITYYGSVQFKNRVNQLSIGSDYKLVPGFVPYIQITGYNMKGNSEFLDSSNKQTVKSSGMVALIGAKLRL